MRRLAQRIYIVSDLNLFWNLVIANKGSTVEETVVELLLDLIRRLIENSKNGFERLQYDCYGHSSDLLGYFKVPICFYV